MRHLKLLRDSMKRILLHGQRGLQNMDGYEQKVKKGFSLGFDIVFTTAFCWD